MLATGAKQQAEAFGALNCPAAGRQAMITHQTPSDRQRTAIVAP